MTEKVVSRLKPPKPRYFFREWRKHRGYKQEDLAEMVGVTPSSISQLETGKQGFTDSTLESLAKALAVADRVAHEYRLPLDTTLAQDLLAVTDARHMSKVTHPGSDSAN